ncbi:MAG: hypothetical protein AVDCRST_MAG66-2471 [uncultured Pseudonocardia sp.]|uniref:Uncharacterized protein n=1 Tax=uncultured Pseudonocardia sp. TaxID=211455 RepID=A0A6J4PRQ5_9PSEU|nr:MAG: hypothetical protein AVDCRST_MAG66-2471 [uncultured Pseudonocardia sp.]
MVTGRDRWCSGGSGRSGGGGVARRAGRAGGFRLRGEGTTGRPQREDDHSWSATV